MFRKVLKYDMASIRRYWWMIAVAVLGLSVIGSFVFRAVYHIMEYESDSLLSFVALAGMLFLFVSILAVFSSVFVTSVLTYLRFYRNFFTDEGYLTFTLPVSRKTLYLSKTVNSVLWASAHVLLLAAGIAIVITLAPPSENGSVLNLSLWEGIASGVSVLWEQLGAWLILYALELILLYICSAALTVGLVQLCITVGSILAKKHKLLASIGIYYAVNMGVSTVSQIVMMFISFFMISGYGVLFERASELVQFGSIALILLLAVLAFAAIAMVLHFVSLGLLERKLNLA